MIFGTWLLGLVAALLVTAIVLFYTLTDVPRPENLPLPQVATIEYSDGSTLAPDRHRQPHDRARSTRCPSTVRWAVLAAEDRGFYSEPGVSITRHAARRAVRPHRRRHPGRLGHHPAVRQERLPQQRADADAQAQGADDRGQAVARSTRKDQILEFYLNTVYFGRGAYGIQAAAQTYFGEDVEQADRRPGRRARRAAARAGLLRPGRRTRRGARTAGTTSSTAWSRSAS